MDLERRTRGRAIKLAFGLGIFYVLCLLLFNGLSTQQHSPPPPACETRMSSDYVDMDKRRLELYEKMAADLDTNGATFLDGGETSQSLKLSDLFKIVNKKIIPVHKPANPAVRANVLHLQHHYASKIEGVVRMVLSPQFSEGVWYQDPQLYHFSLFHASHHLEPIYASATEVHAESAAVEQVAKRCCPLEIVLDRVVLTSTGVLLGCWQVLNGTDPAIIREKLKYALPQAPKKQIYAPEILHTSIARIIGPPDLSKKVGMRKEEALALLKTLVLQLNEELCNFRAKVSELWFVEELDILALALKGRMTVKNFPLECSSSQD